MVVNLVDKICYVLDGFFVILVYCWFDSFVVFYWISGNVEY